MPTPYTDFHLQPIAGEWRSGSSTHRLQVTNPFNQDLLLTLPLATEADLDAAYRAAERAQVEWAQTPPAERAALLQAVVTIFDRRQGEIIDWLIRESGSTRLKANIEWEAARAITQEAASMPGRAHGMTLASNIPGKANRIYRKPLGVLAVISPWNFPLHLSQRSIAPALALGNAVVVKPASDTPVTGGLLLAKIFAEAGLPAGLLSVVVGSSDEIGTAFVTHPTPRMISFTGSTEVGRHIGQLANSGAHLKKVALELGGNSPFVVLDDADIDQAVSAAITGKFLHQGQICMAINRIIVDAQVYDAFVERFVARVKQLPVGDPDALTIAIGPIINHSQRERLAAKIDRAKQQGATVLLEGSINGQLVSPYLFGDVTPVMDISREEIFGPVVGIHKARDEAHALALANASEYGLSSAVFSADLARGERFALAINAGMAHVNDMPVNDEPHIAFGGEKNSGLGRFNGEWAIAEFTTEQWVSVQHTARDYPF